jgi:integrase
MIDLRKHAESYVAKLAVNITKTVQGADGNRITRGTLQYRILRASKTAGLNGERPSGALVHGLRNTFATELANANVSVYTLMKLLGHESVADLTSLRRRRRRRQTSAVSSTDWCSPT